MRDLFPKAGPVLAALLAATALQVHAQSKPATPPDPDAPNAPAVQITNGLVTAVLFLPDADKGYYRATRFDWAGAVADLRYNGHTYFGRWFAAYDPKKHDATMGPVQEYVTGQGLAAAPVGGTFVKIGVGVLRKPEMPIRGFPTLEIVDGGKWTTHIHANSVEYIHEVNDPASGYGYIYHKTLTLPPGKAQLVIDEKLESTGVNPIDTEVYNHNFFMLDKTPSSPDIEVSTPYPLTAVGSLSGMAEITGNRLNYLKVLDAKDKAIHSNLTGFGPTAKDYDIHVDNKKTGAGVEITSDQPLTKIDFWSPATVTCPEAYMHVHAERGKPMTWRITYSLTGNKLPAS